MAWLMQALVLALLALLLPQTSGAFWGSRGLHQQHDSSSSNAPPFMWSNFTAATAEASQRHPEQHCQQQQVPVARWVNKSTSLLERGSRLAMRLQASLQLLLATMEWGMMRAAADLLTEVGRQQKDIVTAMQPSRPSTALALRPQPAPKRSWLRSGRRQAQQQWQQRRKAVRASVDTIDRAHDRVGMGEGLQGQGLQEGGAQVTVTEQEQERQKPSEWEEVDAVRQPGLAEKPQAPHPQQASDAAAEDKGQEREPDPLSVTPPQPPSSSEPHSAPEAEGGVAPAQPSEGGHHVELVPAPAPDMGSGTCSGAQQPQPQEVWTHLTLLQTLAQAAAALWDVHIMAALAVAGLSLYFRQVAARRRLERALRIARQDMAFAAKAAELRLRAQAEGLEAAHARWARELAREAQQRLEQVQQSAALQVEEAEGKTAEATQKLAETEQLMVQQLKDEMSRHGREMEQVMRDHDGEVALLSSSHAEVVRTQRYHMQLQRRALRRIMRSAQAVKDQVIEQVCEVRQQVRALHQSLLPQAACLSSLRARLHESRRLQAAKGRQEQQCHAQQLAVMHATTALQAQQLQAAAQALASQQRERVAALTSRVGRLQAALKAHKHAAQQALEGLGASLKARLATFLDLSARQAWEHQRQVLHLEGQLAAMLAKGQQLRAYAGRLKRALEQRDEEVEDHMRDLEELGEQLNAANSLLAAKEQQIRHDRELRDRLQSSLQEADMRERELEQQVAAAEEHARRGWEAAARIPELEGQAGEVPLYCEKLKEAAARIRQLLERLQAGQQQLEALHVELAARDQAVAAAQEEVQAAHAAIGQREKQLQATLDLQHQRHQAELEVKAKELKHRVDDIHMLKEELLKAHAEAAALRKSRPALPCDLRALQQLNSNTQGGGLVAAASFKR